MDVVEVSTASQINIYIYTYIYIYTFLFYSFGALRGPRPGNPWEAGPRPWISLAWGPGQGPTERNTKYPRDIQHVDVTKPYEFIWFGDIHGPKPYKCRLSK
jgi:hypothetical protein